MNDDLSYDVVKLENLAEASEEARTALEDIRRYFHVRAQRVFSANGLTLQPLPIQSGMMSMADYKKLKPKFTYKIFKEMKVGGGKRMIGGGGAQSIADAYTNLLPKAVSAGAMMFSKENMEYVSPTFRVYMEVEEVKRVQKNTKNSYQAIRSRR